MLLKAPQGVTVNNSIFLDILRFFVKYVEVLTKKLQKDDTMKEEK